MNELFSKQKCAFMPYVCCGDPSAEFTIKLVKTLIANGADAIEFGIPFSDPIADGKTIQHASSRSLKNGMSPKKAIEIIAALRKDGIRIPLIAMTYYNIVYVNGVENFLKSLKNAGADALIVPDVPLEESKSLLELCAKIEIDLIYLITPNCSNERIKKIAEKSKSFLYAVSVLGITGARNELSQDIEEFINRTKKITRLPIAVGFGISKPEHAHMLAEKGANGIIVGSEIINIYSKYITNGSFDEKKALKDISEFTRNMKSAATFYKSSV